MLYLDDSNKTSLTNGCSERYFSEKKIQLSSSMIYQREKTNIIILFQHIYKVFLFSNRSKIFIIKIIRQIQANIAQMISIAEIINTMSSWKSSKYIDPISDKQFYFASVFENDSILQSLQLTNNILKKIRNGFDLNEKQLDEIGEFGELFHFYRAVQKDIQEFYGTVYCQQISQTRKNKKQDKSTTFWQLATFAIRDYMSIKNKLKDVHTITNNQQSKSQINTYKNSQQSELAHIGQLLIAGRMTQFYSKFDIGVQQNQQRKLNTFHHFLYEIGKEYEVFSGIQQKMIHSFSDTFQFTEEERKNTTLSQRCQQYFNQLRELLNKTKSKENSVAKAKQFEELQKWWKQNEQLIIQNEQTKNNLYLFQTNNFQLHQYCEKIKQQNAKNLEQIKRNVASLKLTTAEFEILNNKYLEGQKQIKKSKVKHSQMTEQIAKKIVELSEYEQHINWIFRKVMEISKSLQYEYLFDKHHQNDKRLQSIDGKVNYIMGVINKCDDFIKQKIQQVKKIKKICEQTRRNVEEKEIEIKDLKQKILKYQETVRELKAENETKNTQITLKIDNLNDKIQQYQQIIKQQKEENSELKTKTAKQKRKHEIFSKKSSNKNGEHQFQSQLSVLRNQNSEIQQPKNQCQQLQKQLDDRIGKSQTGQKKLVMEKQERCQYDQQISDQKENQNYCNTVWLKDNQQQNDEQREQKKAKMQQQFNKKEGELKNLMKTLQLFNINEVNQMQQKIRDIKQYKESVYGKNYKIKEQN